MITAIATVAVNLPDIPQHARDTALRDTITVSGEGADWEAAKAACEIPKNSMILHWMKA